MRKLLLILFVSVFVFGMTACGGGDSHNEAAEEATETVEDTDATTMEATEADTDSTAVEENSEADMDSTEVEDSEESAN